MQFVNSRHKQKNKSDCSDLGMLQMSSRVLQTHLAMIQGEHEMLKLRHITLEHRQRIISETEKRIHEERTRSSERRFHTVVESLPCLICQCDRQQRLRYCNTAYRGFIGMPAREILGKYMWEVIGETDYDAMRAVIVGALQ